MIRPLRRDVLIEVDSEDRRIGSLKLLVAADEKRLAFCRRCGVMMEALADAEPCGIDLEEFFATGRFTPGHVIVKEPFPIVVQGSRWATVLVCGPRVTEPEIVPGARVLVDAEAGVAAAGCAFRLVSADAIQAIDEDAR